MERLILPVGMTPQLPPIQPSGITLPPGIVPECPKHCSGREELEGDLWCGACQCVSYRLTNHEWFHNPGHWFVQPVPVGHATPPQGKPRCHKCGGQLERTAPHRL